MSVSEIFSYPDLKLGQARFFDSIDRVSSLDLDKIFDELKKIPTSGKLDIEGVMGIRSAVCKYDLLKFKDQGTLILEAMDADYIAIAVNKIILDIKNPQYRACISRPFGRLEDRIVAKISGESGVGGSPGAPGVVKNRIGQDGGHGTQGGNAHGGGTKQIPYVFFFVQSLQFGEDATPMREYLYLNFKGFPGGNGGVGGVGGTGGKGGNGDKGVLDLWGCRESGGQGGNGGDAGRGGRGGDAGNGGDGGTLYLVGPNTLMFDMSTGNIEGGDPGVVGNEGRPGVVGGEGFGCAAIGACPAPPCCGAKPNGRKGHVPIPSTLGPGDPGVKGKRGNQFTRARDLSDLFL